jgi:hypothetical protein
VINVRDYGATGDGRTDDTAALQRAVDATPIAGGRVHLPAGVYRTTAPLTLPATHPVQLSGNGPEISVLLSTGTGYDAVQFDGTRGSYYTAIPTQVTSLTIATAVNTTGAALAFRGFDLGEGYSINEETVLIRDVTIRPDESTAPVSFAVGIDLAGGWNAVVDNVVIHGDNGAAGMVAGIRLRDNSLDVNISNFRIMNAQTGIEILDRCEGTLIHHGWIISNAGITSGIVAKTRTGTTGEPNKPWLSVTDTHLSVSQFGIFAENHPQCSLSNNLIYKWGTQFFRGIWLEGAGVGGGGHSTVMGNKVFNLSGLGPADGIVINVPSCTIVGNIIHRIARTAIWLSFGATGCVVTGNSAGGAIHDVGAGNLVVNNL